MYAKLFLFGNILSKYLKLFVTANTMSDKQKDKNTTNFVKYSGMGFQMLATIGLFTFAGYKIDAYRDIHKPLFVALLGVAGVIISLYQVVRQLNNKK